MSDYLRANQVTHATQVVTAVLMKQRPGWTARKHAGEHRADLKAVGCGDMWVTQPRLHDVGDAATPAPAPRNIPFDTLLGSKETYLSLRKLQCGEPLAMGDTSCRPRFAFWRATGEVVCG